MFVVDFDAKTCKIIHKTSGSTVEVGDFVFTSTGSFYPAVSIFSTDIDVDLNVGATAFINTIPVGYSSWDDSQTG